MASAWIISDSTLQTMLQDFINGLAQGNNWNIDLYQNNHVPAAGDTAANYTVANFAGYAQGTINNTTWGAAAVTNHIAQTTQATTNQWNATAAAQPQTIFGYFVTDNNGNLKYAEMFANSITMNPSDQLQITPVLRHTTYP
jgi:hypothetical protein